MPGQVGHILGDFDVLDLVEIFLRIPNLVGIAQQRPHQTLVDADGPPPASESRATSATRWYQFCICDIVSALRMSMHGVRTFTESVFLQRTTWPRKRRRQRPRRQPPRKWQRRPRRKRSSRDPRPRHDHLLVATPDAKRNLSKGFEVSFAAVRCRGKVRSGRALCRWLLHSGPVFVSTRPKA